MSIPNILTIFRLALVPVFILIFFSNSKNSLVFSIIVFLIAGFTDVLDGYIARKYNLITKLGIVLDPLADKLMLITVLSCLVLKNYIPAWVLIVIVLKEISMIISGILLYSKNIVIPANIFGKMSTLLFYISIFTLIFNKTIGKLLLYIAVISAIVAFLNYFIIYKKNIHRVKY